MRFFLLLIFIVNIPISSLAFAMPPCLGEGIQLPNEYDRLAASVIWMEKYNTYMVAVHGSASNIILYTKEPTEKYCFRFNEYVTQIRILETCPQGVDDSLPCIEIIMYDFDEHPANPRKLSDGRCMGTFLTYSGNEYGDYGSNPIAKKEIVFKCDQLDELPKTGQLPPGILIYRDLQSTEWENLNYFRPDDVPFPKPGQTGPIYPPYPTLDNMPKCEKGGQ